MGKYIYIKQELRLLFDRRSFSLSKKYSAFMQIDKKVFYDLISKRRTTTHISSVLNARRFAPHVYLPRIVVPNIKNKRNSHFIGLQTDLSRSV